jgi:hypothetical protein
MRQEIRVYQYTIGRNQSCIILKEEGGGDLWSGEMELVGNSERGKADVHFADNICALFFLLGFEFSLGLVFLQSRVVLPDHSLDLVWRVSFLKDFLRRGRGREEFLRRRTCGSSLRLPCWISASEYRSARFEWCESNGCRRFLALPLRLKISRYPNFEISKSQNL